MVQVVNKSQQVATAGLNPKAEYSRVVSINVEVPDNNEWQFGVTPVLAQRFWLLEVQIWAFPKAVVAAQATVFEILTGTSEPKSAEALLNWDNILPIYGKGGVVGPWSMDDNRDYMSWTMEMLFQNMVRRFGVRAKRPVGFGQDGLYVSFKISEG